MSVVARISLLDKGESGTRLAQCLFKYLCRPLFGHHSCPHCSNQIFWPHLLQHIDFEVEKLCICWRIVMIKYFHWPRISWTFHSFQIQILNLFTIVLALRLVNPWHACAVMVTVVCVCVCVCVYLSSPIQALQAMEWDGLWVIQAASDEIMKNKKAIFQKRLHSGDMSWKTSE